MECSTETQLRRGPLRCACEWNRDSPKLVKQIGAEFAYPREIEFVDQIPRTVTGKIKRFELRLADESLGKS